MLTYNKLNQTIETEKQNDQELILSVNFGYNYLELGVDSLIVL